MEVTNKLNYEDIVATIKATINMNKGGIPVKKLNNEFRRMVGKNIPYPQFDYSCLNDFLKSIPGVGMKRNKGEPTLFVSDSKSEHIRKLVENQKDRKTVQKKVNFKNAQNRQSGLRKLRSRNSSTDRKSDGGSEDAGSFTSKDSQQSSIDIKIDPFRQMKIICEPIAFHQQLIGDDFFLQLAIRELRANNLWRKHDKSAIQSGLCISGQTIKDCTKRLLKVDTISSRVVIMLGAVDVYKNHSLERMINDLDALLNLCERKFLLSKSAITLCTIPPLANIPMINDFDRMSTLYGFNSHIRWIINKYNDSPNSYGFIDFFQTYHCTDEDFNQTCINFDLFQIEARMVSGCPNPHVLWNKKGRTKAMELLRCASESTIGF